MRRLKEQKPLSYDGTLLTLEPDAEIVEILKAKRTYKGFRLDRHQVRFLRYEAKRLGWSEAGVVRGILNMYIEQARLREKDDLLNARYWVGASDDDFEHKNHNSPARNPSIEEES